MNAGDELKPDPRLLAALRHAPDADAQAPPEVTARVMAAARAAVARPRWRFAWPRPWALGASGAFASVVMAGFIALLWRGEPPAELAVAPAPAAAPLPAAPPAAAAPPASAEPAATVPPAPELRRRAAQSPVQVAKRAAEPDVEQPSADRAQRAAAAADTQRQSAAAAAALPAPAPSPPAPAPAAAPTVVAEAAAPAAPPAASYMPGARPPSLAEPPLNSGIVTAFAPLAGGRRQPLAWEVDGHVPAPADMAWLRELDRIALPHWRWSGEADAPPGARRVRLSGIGGRATLIVSDSFVQWCSDASEPQRCRRAALEPADARRLLEMLPKP
jgi:hypothetical protein